MTGVPRRYYRSVGESLSVLGLGTWAIRDYRAAEEVLVKAVTEYGVNSIDTAEIYGGGLAEQLVGRVASRVGRDEVFITTKLPPERFRTRESAVKAARASLSRMNLRDVDLLLIHWPDPLVPVERLVRNLEAVADEGLARYVGVSNFSKTLLEEAMEAARKYEIAADQIHYSIVEKGPERESLIMLAAERGLMVQAYRVIERGGVALDEGLAGIAGELGLSPVQLAVAYVINGCITCMALVKTETLDHLEELVNAATLRLSEDVLSKLRRI
ncbi:MAG: aldo/keto reductase [Desulfurococcales archaeon]|nr:aldo/keto reductase [Desulfurococcales archaeon]